MEKHKCPVCKTKNVLIEDLKLEDLNTKSYLCIKCGYTSNSEYVTNSEIMKKMLNNNKYSETLFNLHVFDEETGLYWFPMVLLHPKGAVFPEGTHDNFKWSYVPIVNITEDDKNNYEPEFTKRFAVELKQQYEKFDFLLACKALGAIDPTLKVD